MRVVKAATPEPVKMLGRAAVPLVVKGGQEMTKGLEYVGEHVPGARAAGHVVKDITVGGIEFLDKTLDVMPTAMRRTARTLGLPQNWAQNIGDATHLIQDIVLVVMPAVRAVRMERTAAAVGEVARPKGITLTLEYKPEMDLRDFNRKLHILKTAAKQNALYSKIPHGVPSQERQTLTRLYRKELQRRINSFYVKNPQARNNALEKLRKADIDHMIDLQLGGLNLKKNLKTLDAFTNQDIGRQIYKQLTKGENHPIVEIVKVLR